MNRYKQSAILFIGIALQSFTIAKENNFTVFSKGFNNDKGKAVLFLFRKTDAIPSSPFKTVTVEIKGKEAIFEIQYLAYDDYAIIILHDENSNGKIDHSMGLPSEQLGYSNNWELGFFSGMPTFSKLRFEFSTTTQTQNINISFKRNKK